MGDRKNRFMLDAIHEMNIRLGIYAQSPSLIYLGWDLVWSPITRECRKRCLRWVEAMQASLISQSRNNSTAHLPIAVNTSLFNQDYSMPIEEISEEVQLLIAGGNCLLRPIWSHNFTYPADRRYRFRNNSYTTRRPILLSNALSRRILQASRRNPRAIPKRGSNPLGTRTSILQVPTRVHQRNTANVSTGGRITLAGSGARGPNHRRRFRPRRLRGRDLHLRDPPQRGVFPEQLRFPARTMASGVFGVVGGKARGRTKRFRSLLGRTQGLRRPVAGYGRGQYRFGASYLVVGFSAERRRAGTGWGGETGGW